MAEKPKPPAPDKSPDAEREALLAEVADLKAELARQKAASGQYKPAPAVADFPAGPVKQYMVSLDHTHKGLTTPSYWFAREKPGDPRGRPIEAVSATHAVAIFYQLHGIVGVNGMPAEAREMTPEEIEAGEWGPPPTPGPKREQRVPEPPKRKGPQPPTAARDAALTEMLAF